MSRICVTAAVLALAGCSYLSAHAPGETRTDGARMRAVSKRVLDLAEERRPECRQRKITDTEIVDLHGDGAVAVERWTVTQCGDRARFLVRFPAKGRGSGFAVSAE